MEPEISVSQPKSQERQQDLAHFLVVVMVVVKSPEIALMLVVDYEESYLSSSLKYADQTSQNFAVGHYSKTR
jgi:hypothetical protein